ncbi:MAG: TIGR02452 family protein [Fimbriiglobus sp.]
MKRTARQSAARETLEILDRGSYRLPSGAEVSIVDPLAECINGTQYFTPKDLARLKYEVLASPGGDVPAVIEVRNETTLAGASQLFSDPRNHPVAVLNFASAKNPGGGFLNGAEAQEESLARSSGLYASQQSVPEFYARHRQESSYLYSDAMILSPGCPVLRDDDGALVVEPYRVTFITSAAPNAGAAAANRPRELEQLPDVFRQRAELVLALAAWHGAKSLVLGAWGCGVFRNDPALVAGLFAELLAADGLWRQRFRQITFSVFDSTTAATNYTTFRDVLTRIQ